MKTYQMIWIDCIFVDELNKDGLIDRLTHMARPKITGYYSDKSSQLEIECSVIFKARSLKEAKRKAWKIAQEEFVEVFSVLPWEKRPILFTEEDFTEKELNKLGL